MSLMGVEPSICRWVRDLLTNRPRQVRLGHHMSDPRSTHRGPQGCVLSPCLYSLYTNDCTFNKNSIKLFADNTDLLRGNDESAYWPEVSHLVSCVVAKIIWNSTQKRQWNCGQTPPLCHP